jgi:hypothetical protein
VAFSLLGYFASMIIVLTAAVGAMIGLFSFSTSERVGHTPHPRPAIERNVTVTNGEPRLFMSAPDTKDGSPAKNTEAGSTVAPDETAQAKTTKLHKHKAIARKRNNYEPSFGMGYAEYTRNGPQRPFSTW